MIQHATVVVIGAGQAGLSAAFHLRRQGFSDATTDKSASRTFVVFDGNPGPGGAWQHRWESLRVGTLNAIFDLPGMAKPNMDPLEPSRSAVPRYFGMFEDKHRFPILRPGLVTRVNRLGGANGMNFQLDTSVGLWETRFLINATGTWNNPTLPKYPGADTFLGMQLHTRDYVRHEDFAGRITAVVGGGISALQQLEEISRITTTRWYTRRPIEWMNDEFDTEAGRRVIERVTADVEAGRPTGSVVSYTGLPWAPYTQAAHDRGALVRRPMFVSIEPYGVREADGSFSSIDAVLWATGFKGDLAHLDPLQLRNELGGIRMCGTRVANDRYLHLIGFGPSQSTVGANRAGRDAVAEIVKDLTG